MRVRYVSLFAVSCCRGWDFDRFLFVFVLLFVVCLFGFVFLLLFWFVVLVVFCVVGWFVLFV